MAKKAARRPIQPARAAAPLETQDFFDLTFALETDEKVVGVDERSAIMVVTVTANAVSFPEGKEAADIKLEIDLSSLPEQVTIGAIGQTGAGHAANTTWHPIGPAGNIKRPVGLDPNPESVEFRVEIKTGFFAGLEISAAPSVTQADVKSTPTYKSATPTILGSDVKLSARITCVMRDLVLGETRIQDTGETISFAIVD